VIFALTTIYMDALLIKIVRLFELTLKLYIQTNII